MGLFDSVLGAVSGQLQQQGGLANVLGGLLAADGGQGGLGGLVEKFNQAGLGDVVASWIGKDENLPISADQIGKVFGPQQLSQFASQAGLSPDAAGSTLASLLPQLVDKLTPDGQLPAGNQLPGLDVLAKLLK